MEVIRHCIKSFVSGMRELLGRGTRTSQRATALHGDPTNDLVETPPDVDFFAFFKLNNSVHPWTLVGATPVSEDIATKG